MHLSKCLHRASFTSKRCPKIPAHNYVIFFAVYVLRAERFYYNKNARVDRVYVLSVVICMKYIQIIVSDNSSVVEYRRKKYRVTKYHQKHIALIQNATQKKCRSKKYRAKKIARTKYRHEIDFNWQRKEEMEFTQSKTADS